MAGRPGERGAALVMVLVFAAGLAAAAVAFIEGRQSDGLALRAQMQAVEAEAVLEAALQQTAALLANRSQRQIIPGRLAWRMGTADIQVLIESEAGKVDLNTAEEPLLQSLPLALGASEDQAAAFAQTILDWRDDNAERHNQGAEDRDYDRAERGSSGAADRPFAHPSELRYLAAVDPALWARLEPLVTVYSGVASPKRTDAPEPVRRAMTIAQGLASASDAADDAADTDGTGATDADAASTDDEADPSGFTSRNSRDSAGGSGLSGRQGERGLGSGDGAGEAEADGSGAEGTTTEEASGAHAVLLDVRFPNGYEAAARAVIGFRSGSGSDSAPPFTVLDWAPILREQGGME